MTIKTILFSLLLLGNFTNISAQNRLMLVTKNTTLREQSNSVAKKILRLSVNDTLVFLGNCDQHFCMVSFQRQIGWAKKKCIRELYTYKKRSTKSNNQPIQPTQTVQPIQTKDTNAWDTVTIQKDAIQECAFVERVSPLEDVFQRLRRVKAERHYGDEVNMEINVLEQGGEEIYGQSEDDLEDGEKKPGEVLIMYSIALVIFLYFIKKSIDFICKIDFVS